MIEKTCHVNFTSPHHFERSLPLITPGRVDSTPPRSWPCAERRRGYWAHSRTHRFLLFFEGFTRIYRKSEDESALVVSAKLWKLPLFVLLPATLGSSLWVMLKCPQWQRAQACNNLFCCGFCCGPCRRRSKEKCQHGVRTWKLGFRETKSGYSQTAERPSFQKGDWNKGRNIL